MRVLLNESVRDAAKRRISWIYDEFDNVVVNHSGGKDSDVVWHLALEVAREKDRLPLRTCFLDSEAEWQATIDRMYDVMNNPDVDPVWLQVPVTMYLGATSHEWFTGWDPAHRENWIHEQQPNAVTEPFADGEIRFMEIFPAWAQLEYPNERLAKLVGIRAEESPARMFGMQSREVYKGETWGAVEDEARGHYLLNPIYDWAFNDIWKAICEGGWDYNRLYDEQYRIGTPSRSMRVADLTMGDMSRNALRLAELEPETYVKLQRRIGPEALEKMEMRGWFPERLPPMFDDWTDYRDYLLENLVDTKYQAKMARKFASTEKRFPEALRDQIVRMQVGAVLISDWKGTKSADWEAAHAGERLPSEAAT